MAHSIESLAAGELSLDIARAMKTPMTVLGKLQLNCSRHGVYMASGTRLRTRDIWSRCDCCKSDQDEADRAERRLANERRLSHEHQAMLQTAAVPARFIGRTLESFRTETVEQERALNTCRAFVSQWEANFKRGSWLVFSGPPGTGKSHLAVAILQAVLPRYVGRYMTCAELIQLLRSTWRKDSETTELQTLDMLTHIPLLVLDEIGVQYGTESEQIHLFDVLDRRYREMQPTILLTNLSKDGFREFVGDRVYDRMTEVAKWVPFPWASYRPTARREIPE